MVIKIIYPSYLTLFQSEFLNVAIHTNQINVSFLFSLYRPSHDFQVFFCGGEEEQTLASTASFVGKNVY